MDKKAYGYVRPDKDSTDRLGAAVATGGVGLGATAFGSRGMARTMSLFPGNLGMVVSNTDKGVGAAVDRLKVHGVPLREWLAQHGVGLRNSTLFIGGSSGPAFIPRIRPTEKFLSGLGIKDSKGAILLGFKENAPRSVMDGIAGHELGHAARHVAGRSNPRLAAASKILSTVLGVGGVMHGALGKSDKTDAVLSAATGVAAIPMLHEEIQASRLGGKMLGLKGMARLRTFRGVPSYLAAASAPAMLYGFRKLFGGIDKKAHAPYSSVKGTTAHELGRAVRYIRGLFRPKVQAG